MCGKKNRNCNSSPDLHLSVVLFIPPQFDQLNLSNLSAMRTAPSAYAELPLGHSILAHPQF
jgi:hypothetical protein